MSSYEATRIVGVAELTRFLTAVDRHLGSSERIVIIGGSAAVFHGATSATNDIDTLESTSVDLRRTCRPGTLEL